jgi:hypothetical protein
MSRLLTSRWSPVLLVFFVAIAGRTLAIEIPPLSKEKLESESDLIVAGTVTEVKVGEPKQDSRGIRETPYRVVLEVGQVTKGKVTQGKQLITALGSNYTLPAGMVGTAGIRSANTHDLLSGVRKGWQLRLYLKANKDGTYDILSPNGFAVFKKPETKGNG